MKFSIKVLMAALLFALPFAFISCGSDDDDDSPKTFKYEWTLSNTTPTNGTTAEKAAALTAETSINASLAKAFAALGTVDQNAQTLTITGGDADTNDKKVKSSYYAVAVTFTDIAEALPNSARITIKRGGTKVINTESLK